MKRKELSWKPVRRGAIYCAPACGSRCTYASYLEAKRKGTALAKRLGPGWKGHVWENMGWHYKATAMGVENGVYNHGSKENPNFWADLHLGGKQFHANARTPKLALKAAVALAQATVDDLAKALEVFNS